MSFRLSRNLYENVVTPDLVYTPGLTLDLRSHLKNRHGILAVRQAVIKTHSWQNVMAALNETMSQMTGRHHGMRTLVRAFKQATQGACPLRVTE